MSSNHSETASDTDGAVPAEPARQRPQKSIVVFSDGTGNSSAKLFKTNVWRLYRAVDTTEPAAEEALQIVMYDDGVGTSSFKPLALLGGAIGFGLMRNVLDLYKFICLNYEHGDRIYAFGFSRGAFTIRVLIGLITTVGLIDRHRRDVDTDNIEGMGAATISHSELDLLASDAYRKFRWQFVLSGDRRETLASDDRGLTGLFVDRLRNLRDRWIMRRRKRAGQPILDEKRDLVEVSEITFVGVWDTVAAYGSPIAEITKGIDRWVWPLSMPDYKLSPKVRCARHALALDDERDTFRPLLWDEVNERELAATGEVAEGRVRQVWFAGMHSDVGGGYSDDSLAHVSLLWMIDEAVSAGLRLHSADLADFAREADVHGPMHDSRSGLSNYYRYQPRRISALLEERDPTTRVIQDPDFDCGLLTSVIVHDSVLQRIERMTEGYAPIVLPSSYSVEGGQPRERFATSRARAQERAWDKVWRRRVNYFSTLAVTIALVFIGLMPPSDSSCIGPQCVLTPAISRVGDWLPSFASTWVEAYADRPGPFIILVILLFVLLRGTTRLEASLRDLMRKLWLLSIRAPAGAEPKFFAEAARPSLIRKLRTSTSYQRSLQFVKWRATPGIAALLIYAVVSVLGLSVMVGLASTAHRAHLTVSARDLCERYGTSAEDGVFATSDICWQVPDGNVERGQRYRLVLEVDGWSDGDFSTSPAGYSTSRFEWWQRGLAVLLRRSINDPWFQPLVHVADYELGRAAIVSVPMTIADYEDGIYVGEFVAPRSGQLMLSVNDAIFLWAGTPTYFYDSERGRNSGTAEVRIEACDDSSTSRPCRF